MKYLTCFNSIKVRLKQTGGLLVVRADGFQFHKGAIKTDIRRRRHDGALVSIP